MKQSVGGMVSEVLWYAGDWLSRPMLRFDWVWIYPVYNWLMDASYRTQQWAGTEGPWTHNNIEDNK
jgi:hypothetical protein